MLILDSSDGVACRRGSDGVVGRRWSDGATCRRGSEDAACQRREFAPSICSEDAGGYVVGSGRNSDDVGGRSGDKGGYADGSGGYSGGASGADRSNVRSHLLIALIDVVVRYGRATVSGGRFDLALDAASA